MAVYHNKRQFGHYNKDRSLITSIIRNPKMLLLIFFPNINLIIFNNYQYLIHLRSACCLSEKRGKERNVLKKQIIFKEYQ